MENKEVKMSYEEKVKLFNSKSAVEALNNKTNENEMPIELGFGSSTHHPEKKGGMTTCDFKLWCKFGGSDWFVPNVFRSKHQVLDALKICVNDNQVVSLMELLSAKKVN